MKKKASELLVGDRITLLDGSLATVYRISESPLENSVHIEFYRQYSEKELWLVIPDDSICIVTRY